MSAGLWRFTINGAPYSAASLVQLGRYFLTLSYSLFYIHHPHPVIAAAILGSWRPIWTAFLGICKCCASHWPIGAQRSMHRLLLLSQWPNKDESMAMIRYGYANCHYAVRNCNGCHSKNLLAAFWRNARILRMHVSKPMCVRCEIKHPAQAQELDRLYPASKIWYQICLIPRDKISGRPCF